MTRAFSPHGFITRFPALTGWAIMKRAVGPSPQFRMFCADSRRPASK